MLEKPDIGFGLKEGDMKKQKIYRCREETRGEFIRRGYKSKSP